MQERAARPLISGLLLSGVSLSALVLGISPGLAAGPVLTITPTFDHPSAKVAVTGTGFGAKEAVDIYFDTTDELLVVSDATGKLSKHTFKVPADSPPGEHWVTAIGRRDGDGAQKLFTVATTWAEHGFKANGKRNNPWENVVTTGNAKKLDTAWVTNTGAEVFSSAAVVNGIAYVGAADASGIGMLYAFNASNGSVLWSASTHAFGIGSSPAVANGIVYIGAEDGDVWAFNVTTGATVWSAATGAPGTGILSSPAVADGIVYVGCSDDKLYAFNASSGALLWSSASGGFISSPAVANGVVFVGSGAGKVSAVDAATGNTLWGTPISGVSSSPAVAGGVVYIGSSDDSLYALNAANGGVLWAAVTDAPISSSPAVANGIVYVDPGDRLYAFDANTGAALWSAPARRNGMSPQRLASSHHSAAPPFTLSLSSPSVANGVVYVGSADSNIYAYDSMTGASLWSASTGDAIQSSPTIADGMVFVGSDDYRFYAYSLDGGNNAIYKHRHTTPPSFAMLHPDHRLKPAR